MTGRILATAGKDGNNFDLLRLFAASAVIFSHSFGLIVHGGHAAADPLFILTAGQLTFGELGVYIFFISSGFLITASLQRSSGLWSYTLKRLLRIVPGLGFVVVLSIVLFGPVFTTLPLNTYFEQRETYTYLRNVFMFVAQPDLPGVFSKNPLAGMVNGSLWTLKFELFCYVVIAGIGKLRQLDPWKVATLAIVTIVTGQLYNGFGSGYIFYLSFFLCGSALFLLRNFVPVNFAYFVLALIILAIATWVGALSTVVAIAGSYCVIYLAYVSNHGERFRRRFGDYSYGIYLFGFPVQQGVIAMMDHAITWQQLFFTAYPITVLCAMLSWKFIENPAMNLRSRMVKNAL